MHPHRLAVALFLVALPALSQIPSEADARKTCAAIAHYQPGPQAQATAADRQLYAHGDCRDFFYAFPIQRRDYEKGRRCALVQKQFRELALLFANGWGTPRDYDAATYFLCQPEQEMAPAEIWGMLGQIQGMRKAKEPKDLDYCDNVTSGYGMQWCGGLQADQQAVDREARLASLRRRLPATVLPALQTLQKAADEFAQADAEAAADGSRGGTIYPSQVIFARTTRQSTFVSILERLASHRWLAVTPEALKQSDDRLNQVYQKALATFFPAPQDGTGGTGGSGGPKVLRKAQRAWLAYRDAWIAFYRLRWQGTAPAADLDREVTARLNKKRSDELVEYLQGR